jgi:hypothetical protein
MGNEIIFFILNSAWFPLIFRLYDWIPLWNFHGSMLVEMSMHVKRVPQ